MANGFDVGAAIKRTIEKVIKLESLPLILCTDLKSLYDCLVKLGTTYEKRLMVVIMYLCQSYERRQITEVIWIDRGSNPADAITKIHPCQVLQDLIDSNTINLKTAGWVERAEGEMVIKGMGMKTTKSKTKSPQCVTPFISPYPFPTCLSLLLLIYLYFPYLALLYTPVKVAQLDYGTNQWDPCCTARNGPYRYTN
jgi:hypothetical protein